MALALALLFDIVFQDPWRHTPTQVHHATPVYKGKGRDPLDWKSYRMIMVVSTLWKLYDIGDLAGPTAVLTTPRRAAAYLRILRRGRRVRCRGLALQNPDEREPIWPRDPHDKPARCLA